MLSDEEMDRITGEVAKFYEDPKLLRIRDALAEIIEPIRKEFGAAAVTEMLERMAADAARDLGMTDEEFRAQHAAIGATVRLHKIAAARK